MKILGRIIIILIAALAVIGAATALAGNSSARFPDADAQSRFLRQDQPEDFHSHDRFHEGDRDAPSLLQEGYRVVEASHGHEALYVARYEKPDLIILDLMMPEMGGHEIYSVVTTAPTPRPVK